MAEVVGWPEGQIYVWTGTATASALVGYAENLSLTFQRGFINRETLSGGYYDYTTGRRADVNCGAVWSYDGTLRYMYDSATAVHMKLIHSSLGNSAGYLFYSGRMDTLAAQGAEGNVLKFNIQAHFNVWSAF